MVLPSRACLKSQLFSGEMMCVMMKREAVDKVRLHSEWKRKERRREIDQAPASDVLLKCEGSERTTNALRAAKSCLNPLAWADLADSPAAVLTVWNHNTQAYTHI